MDLREQKKNAQSFVERWKERGSERQDSQSFWLDLLQEEQKEKIEKTAQGILNARQKYATSSLASLYDETIMPVELRKAHQENDKAVMDAYGFRIEEYDKKRWLTESETVAKLFEMYEEMMK